VTISKCQLCGGNERYYCLLTHNRRFDQCKGCGLLTRTSAMWETNGATPATGDAVETLETGMPRALLTLLETYVSGKDLRLGILGKRGRELRGEAQQHGYRASVIAEGEPPAQAYDVIVVLNQLEDCASPVEFVKDLRGHLAPGGTLVIATRQLMRQRGRTHSSRAFDQRQSFSDTNLQTVLWQAGFADVFLSQHLGTDHAMRAEPWFNEQTLAFGRMHRQRAVPRLSVIVPVFNEHSTVAQVLDALAVHKVPGVELEIVVVESGSTDGSREIVRNYESVPRFKIVYEERPRGKGFAVRNGFTHATGDVFLIQDADLEYDLLDYQVLVEPIVSGRAAFVLGTRHAGDWKIRKFARNRLANAMNLAHWGFVFAINQVYDQSMTDPFTMFKVFRSDCLYGLDFECDRFDFDWEIVCKVLRKGYVPLEIPVNYQSRGFEEGKKVRVFRDPPTWLRALMKYRNATPRQLREPSRGLRALEEGADDPADEPLPVERLRPRVES
jgi:hypothetical protein